MEVNEIRLDRMTNAYLASVYDELCEEYRRRLCKQWELHDNQVFWIPSDRKGELIGVDVIDGMTLSMDELREVVEYGVTYEQFTDYLEACERGGSVSVRAWFGLQYRGEKGGVG